MRNDRIDLKEAAEPSGLFSAARRRSIRSRHELGLTQSCEVRRLIVQIQRKNKAKTKRFILAYRLINFATPSVAFDLHVNLKYNYSKLRRFCTSSARPKILMALRLWNPRDRYPIVPMEPTPAEIRVAFSFVERNYMTLQVWLKSLSLHSHFALASTLLLLLHLLVSLFLFVCARVTACLPSPLAFRLGRKEVRPL